MDQAASRLPVLLDRDDYRRWSSNQPRGRFERVGGEVFAMASERVAHIRVKNRVWQALDQAIRRAGLDCEALGDGLTIEIGDHTDYEPDAVVNCGLRLDGDRVAASNPVIIVEVTSPSTRSLDTGAKLTDYLSLPSVRHYLIVRADRIAVIHHRRDDNGTIGTRLVADGPIVLDPPGIVIEVGQLYAV